jgi:hypothetical protein
MNEMSNILNKIKKIKISRLKKDKEYYIKMKHDCCRHQKWGEASEWRDKEKNTSDIIEMLKNEIK